MSSILDSAELNARLFFPFPRTSPPPPQSRALRVPVDSGAIELDVRIHEHVASGPLILLFHGNGEVVADYDQFVSPYTGAGADLAVTDYRGYGASGGTPTLRTCLSDAHAVLRAVHDAVPDRALIVMGRSLGSACAAELCREPRDFVRAYIFESGFADLEALVRRRGMTLTAPLDEEALAMFDPLRKLRACTTRTLVMHGAVDTLIAASESQLLFDALGTKDKELVLIPGAGHNDLMMYPLYFRSIAKLVREASV